MAADRYGRTPILSDAEFDAAVAQLLDLEQTSWP